MSCGSAGSLRIDSFPAIHYTRRMHLSRRILLIPAATALFAFQGHAQQRPLVTERATTVEEGHLQFDVGFEFLQDAVFPFSGLEGDLTNAGVIGARFGAGSRVEVQVLGTVQKFLNVNGRFEAPGSGNLDFSGNSTSDFGNISLATKVRLSGDQKGKPVFAFRFGVELPNSSTEKGLGTDETNAFVQVLAQHSLNRLDLIGNVGMAILGDPVDAGAQDDLLTYGVAAVAKATEKVNILAEIYGRTGASGIGTEDQSRVRAGLQFKAGGVVWDVAGFWGLEDTDPDSGFIIGFSKTFKLW